MQLFNFKGQMYEKSVFDRLQKREAERNQKFLVEEVAEDTPEVIEEEVIEEVEEVETPEKTPTEKYQEKYGKQVPVNMKNNEKWILSKI